MPSTPRSRWVTLLLAPLRRPGLVLAVSVLLAGISLWVASRAQPSSSIQDLLGKRDPAAAALGRLMEEFSTAEELLVLVSLEASTQAADDGEQGVGRLLGHARTLSKALTESPRTTALCPRVSYSLSPQVTEFFTKEAVPAGLLYLDESEYRALRERLTPGAMREQFERNERMIAAPGPAGSALAKALIKDPLRLREFLGERVARAGGGGGFTTWKGRPEYVSSDGKSVLLRIAGAKPPSDLDFAKLMTARVDEVVQSVSAPGLRVELSGAYAIAAASERAIRADLTSSIMWSVVIMQAVFLLGYRNLLSFPLAFIPVAIGLMVAFGAHTLIASGLTPLTAAIGAVLVGCGIDYPVYFISFFEAARKRGLPASAAGEDALAKLAVPLLAGCATSVVGFIAIAASRVQALRDFAFLGAMGLTFALLGAMWVLPALLSMAAKAKLLGSAGPRIHIGGLIRAVCARPRLFIGLCAGVAISAAASIAVNRGVHFETDLRVMHPTPNAPLDTQRVIGEKFGAADSMIVYIEAPDKAELVRRAFAVDRALGGVGGVGGVGATREAAAGVVGSFGLPALLPDPSKAEARAAEIEGLEVDPVLAAFDAAVGESIFDPSAFADYKQFLRRLLTNTDGPTLETLDRYPDLQTLLVGTPRGQHAGQSSTVALLTLNRNIESANEREAMVVNTRAALREIPGATLTGLSVVGYDVERSVRRDLPLVVGLALGAVVILLFLSLRSARALALALLPVAFGVLCLLGYMSLTGERFNLVNTVAIPLLIGVGVDYGIFEVSMSEQARVGGEGAEGLLTRIEASLHAMLISATTNIIGFGSLAFTSTPAVASMGRVIAVGVAASVCGTLLMLAPILITLARKREQRGEREGAVRPLS